MSQPAGVQESSVQIVRRPQALRAALAGASSVEFVPTMGFLHQGHANLIRRARAEAGPHGRVVVSIFVNPLQFAPTEDLSRYPRDLERDRTLATQAGADLIFFPEVEDMYPAGFATSVTVGAVSEALEGASRPGHFSGVATVVLKLLNLVGADRAYFGEKDWQQLAVVRQMVRDLNHPTRIVGVPTTRADSGLALSSRNNYLNAEQQHRAAVLSRALRAVQAAYSAGERQLDALLSAGQAVLAQEPEVQLDYLQVVGEALIPLTTLPPTDPPSVQISEHPLPSPGAHNLDMPLQPLRVLIAARLFGVRLIDNMPLDPGPTRLDALADSAPMQGAGRV
ncbi:pantoate--beta-alanine ligase [Deinococcus sp. KNUC1210]|uniref:pantoate--beta-alanine ligase n=1 Tax=Deinococcus sp. KNUC1210 TaxID=2917691 RepID=UPI001EF0101E|nr:pantoate--beta-alanine ligase [Deinococcus sp. KNUC1210]ULH15659.1 pantoate--beta-alanine ligase [Deinococcus sp. KNUC1210]